MARPGRPRPRARAPAPRPAGQPKPWGGGAGRSAERGNPPPGRGAGSRAGALSRTRRPHSRGAMAPAGVPGAKKGILERLGSGEVVVGGDSFLITLEKRGYVKAGLWTLEVAADHPDTEDLFAQPERKC
ncbi:translation initiation factor IF-2-like isoform X2 [Mustela putorius furo]|uniref:Translation initiation factor IF-2-like isoform X2 n=1 Tax=Mustela putorius furo TaxID=9669 RepID=A0A8U0RWP9_MUSPF|nr:translation initiation factor IF-2-like isoform X2 [Mustela putorius furo]